MLLCLLETSHGDFDSDEGNTTKNSKKHGVELLEIEDVFRSGLALPLGEQINSPGMEQRLGMIGPNLNGRLLHIAFVLRSGKVRVISARAAHKKERIMYEKILREVSQRL